MKSKGKKIKINKAKVITALVSALVLAGLMVFLFSGDNFKVIKSLFRSDITKDEVQVLLSSLGWKAYIVLGILSTLQVVVTFVPAEPIQVMAGVSLGIWKGTLICVIGIIIGSTIIYILNKVYGQKLTKYFKTNAEFDFESAAKSTKIALVIVILGLLPAIPYGLICFFAASLGLKYPKYILVTVLGAVPSVILDVSMGQLVVASSWILSIAVCVVLIVIMVVLFKNKAKVFAKVNAFVVKRNNALDRHCMFIYDAVTMGCKIKYDKKIKVKWNNTVGRLKRPSIVLCNHGSFIDFIYAARMLRREKPYFVTARLYFYHKILGKLMKKVGCIPKSMFTSDFENAKTCLKVLSNNRVLVMMPEARLSTVGEFEGIQESTYKFIKKSGATVYALKCDGDYLANPKWGDGARGGALVEATLTELFTPDLAKELPFDEFKEKVDDALYYNEYEWLDAHPEISYKSKTIAEGLENILYRCPKCGKLFSMKTKGKEIFCEACDFKDALGDRYEFVGGVPFANIKDWYDWQNGLIEKQILEDENFKLESKVELRHATKGKGFTQKAGDGVCTLDRKGLTYKGTDNGEVIEKFFPTSQIYRLLFGAGEDFEIYEGKEIWYFVPEERRSCVLWYVASGLFKDLSEQN